MSKNYSFPLVIRQGRYHCHDYGCSLWVKGDNDDEEYGPVYDETIYHQNNLTKGASLKVARGQENSNLAVYGKPSTPYERRLIRRLKRRGLL